MKRFVLSALITMAMASTAQAQTGPTCYLGTLLSAVPMNGAAGTRTISLGPSVTCYKAGTSTTEGAAKIAAYGHLVLCHALTSDMTTTLVATHLVGIVTSATFAPGECSVSSGVCTSSGGGVTNIAIAGASVSRCHRYDIEGYPLHSIVMSEAGADANELLTTTGYLAD